MTQLIIDTGAAPNDGTGDPLRTAFTKTNYDFSAIYAAGPVDSNVRITNNTILTLNTNGNLVLAPNGIGNVVSNVNILPNMSNIRSLGSTAYRWDTIYGRYLDAGSANIGSMNIGNANIGNIATITIGVGNIHILGGTNGYVLQTDGAGNLTWTAQTGGGSNATPGGANTQIQFNDAGTFGGSAGFTFDNVANLLSVPGNVSGNYGLFNEVQINDLSTNAILYTNSDRNVFNTDFGYDVDTNTMTGGNISATGNITAGGFTTTGASGNITGVDYITANYFVGNGSQLTNLYANTVSSFGTDFGIGPNYATNDPAILFGEDDVFIRTGGTANTGGQNYGELYLAGSEDAYFGQADNLVDSTYPTFNTSVFANANIISINTPGDYTWVFDNNGTATFPGNIVGNGASPAPSINGFDSINAVTLSATGNVIGGNLYTTGSAGNITMTGGDIIGANVVNANTVVGGGNLTLQPTSANSDAYLDIYLTTGPDIHIAANSENLILGRDEGANITVGANGTVVVRSDDGNAHNWTFGPNSDLTVPGDILAEEGNDLAIKVFNPNSGGGVSYVVQNRQVDLDYDRTTQFTVAPGNIQLITDFSGNKNEWTFNADGSMSLPNVGNVTTAAIAYVADDEISFGTGTGNISIWPGDGHWVFDTDGNITLPSNSSSINYANGQPYGGSTSVAEAPFVVQTGNFNAEIGGRYGVDTYSADGPVTATLPTSPSNGDAVFFADAGNYANNGALTIDAGTNTIMDGDTTMVVSTNNQSVGLFWNGRTWRIYNAG